MKYLVRWFLVSLLMFTGCEGMKYNGLDSYDEQIDFSDDEVYAKIGASMNILWPFGTESPADWSGDEGSRTNGGTIYCACGTRNSHSGAEYYSRDLNRIDGTDEGKAIYAGISGRVVVAGSQSGYGKTVVIYDANRHVAVRYAHMQSVGVTYNQYVSPGKFIGRVGQSGNAGGMPHLHLVGFENIDHFYSNGDPVIPTLCDSDYYSLALYFTF